MFRMAYEMKPFQMPFFGDGACYEFYHKRKEFLKNKSLDGCLGNEASEFYDKLMNFMKFKSVWHEFWLGMKCKAWA